MRARATIAALGAVGALLAGCGGGDDTGGGSLSADDYRAQLDTACATLSDSIDGLATQDGSAQDLQQAADAANEKFDSTLAGLEPPDELADAHQELVDLGDQAPAPGAGLDEIRDYVQRNLDAFEAVGATGCVKFEQQSLDRIDEAG